MGNFLDNVIDWGLSCERVISTPLPVWTCKCGHVHVIGSREELVKLGHNVDPDIELHPPVHRQRGAYLPEVRRRYAP